MSGELEVVSNNELLEKMNKSKNSMVLKEDSDGESEQTDDVGDDIGDDLDDDIDDENDDETSEGEQNDDEELNSGLNKKEKGDITTKKVTNINDTTILKSDKLLPDSDSDSDSDSEDFDNKFSNYDKNAFITVNHPELLNHNYEEIDSLSTITKDDGGIIIDPLHTTIPFLTKYEKTRVLGYRTKQLNNGSKPYVEVKNNILDNYELLDELNEKNSLYCETSYAIRWL